MDCINTFNSAITLELLDLEVCSVRVGYIYVSVTVCHFMGVLCLAAPHSQNMGCGGASKQSITAPVLEKPLATDIGVTRTPEPPQPQPALPPAESLSTQSLAQPAAQPVSTELPPSNQNEAQLPLTQPQLPPLLLPTQHPEPDAPLQFPSFPQLPAAPFHPQPSESPLLSPAEVLNKRKELVRDSLEALPLPKPSHCIEATSAGPEVLQEEVLVSSRAPLSPSLAQPGKLELSSEVSQVLMSPDSLRAEELPRDQGVPESPPGKPGLLQLESPKSD